MINHQKSVILKKVRCNHLPDVISPIENYFLERLQNCVLYIYVGCYTRNVYSVNVLGCWSQMFNV